MPKILFLVSCFFALNVSGQITESFSDGEFTGNPVWLGDTSGFAINSSFQLQSANTVANSNFYLSTENVLATSAQWEMYVQLDFNTSSANYVDIYLTASASDLTSTNTSGYFVRIGNTDDEISLYRKDADGTSTKIIDGADKILTSNNLLKLRVIRSAANEWTLLRDLTGTGTSYITEDVVTDSTYTTSSYFGYLIKQSTASFFQKHFFDEIEVKAYTPDVAAPAIQSINAVSANAIDVLFSEAMDTATAHDISNYSVDNSVGSPVIAITDAFNSALVHLTFASNFPNGSTNTITTNNVKDLAGNAIVNGTATFSYYTPQRYDVVIDEIFPDPTSVVGLPDAEFIEVKNTSGKSINLQGWKLNSVSAVSGAFPSYILPADSFLVITGSSNAAFFAAYGNVLGITSFPSLDNTGTTLSLISKEGLTIHVVSYNTTWFQNDVKSGGGWSLEMIDTRNPCTGANNWRASTDPRGGTPAAKNSVDGNNPDKVAPALARAAATDSVTIVLTFSEPIDSTSGANTANYSISDGINTPITAVTTSPAFNQVQLTLATPVIKGAIYTVTANNITDCSGNVIQALKTAKLGLPSVIDSLEIIINEILFNPKPNGVDYVEIYNRTSSVFDLKDVYIANRSSATNALGSLRQLTTDNLLLFPGDFFVICEAGSIVKQNYVVKTPENFIDVTMPSLPDDEGVVVLLNAQGKVVDELRYSSKWHSALIDNEEGISLERIDYNKPTQNPENWHSAASTAGFGTPSYQNSQFRTDVAGQGEITITPKTFSPDNDGFEDFATVNYQVTELGFVANITVYDAAGRLVKSLAKNATLALTGSFRWDGLNDKFNKVPVGVYVTYTELYNLNGKKRNFKNTVIVASRF